MRMQILCHNRRTMEAYVLDTHLGLLACEQFERLHSYIMVAIVEQCVLSATEHPPTLHACFGARLPQFLRFARCFTERTPRVI